MPSWRASDPNPVKPASLRRFDGAGRGWMRRNAVAAVGQAGDGRRPRWQFCRFGASGARRLAVAVCVRSDSVKTEQRQAQC
jgi:hypothetical protein